MTSPRPKYEGWLYGLAFLIALGFRLIQLGAKPLTDSEAQFALQALHLAQGKDTLLGPQPAYILFTSLVFLLTESANFTARLVPALAGSALVFVPYHFRERLKPIPALILAFLFAFDPGFVALSRQANGTILAVTFLLLAWGMRQTGRAVPAGLFAALALLSGPSVWSGLVILSLASLFVRRTSSQTAPFDWRTAAFAFGASLLLGGTLFLTTPNGLSALLNSIPAYVQSWISPSVFTPGHVLFALLAYEPLALLLAVFALLRGFRLGSRRVIRLSIWAGAALLVAVLHRQTSELAWVIIPVLILAAQELSRVFDIYPEERGEISVVAGALMILLVFLGFNLTGLGLAVYDPFATTPMTLFGRVFEFPLPVRYLVLFVASLIMVICISLVAFGWSPRTARLGVTWSFSMFLGVYTVAFAWGASGVRIPNGVELWKPDQPPTQAGLLAASVRELSLFSRGDREAQPVTVTGIDSPALEWVLRDFDVQVVSTLDPFNAPPIVITPFMTELELPSAYRGQDFTWREQPQWDTVSLFDWFRWLSFRQLPRQTETVILWARDDLFPDARENEQP